MQLSQCFATHLRQIAFVRSPRGYSEKPFNFKKTIHARYKLLQKFSLNLVELPVELNVRNGSDKFEERNGR